MRIKHIVCFAILLLTLMGCAEKEMVLTQEHLRGATLENFVINEEIGNQVQYVVEEKVFTITNLLSQEVTSNGITYFFLPTDTENKPLLVVLNKSIDKLQWGEYNTEKRESIVLTQKDLENATVKNFMLLDNFQNQLCYISEEKVLDISNLVTQDINQNRDVYFFLETDTENEQLLVILNRLLNKLQWTEYYTEHCYFDPEGLVAFVVEPLPERYQEATFKIYDLKKEHFMEHELDFIRTPGHSVGDKQFYYLTPIYAEKDEWGTYKIYWEQAHYSLREYFYSPTQDKYKFRSRVSRTILDELEPLLDVVNEWAIPLDYYAIAGNTSENFDVVFIAPEGEIANWENCEIFYYNRETEEAMQVLFASVFRYQDELLGITPAQNRDERVAFIVETKEFNYDFYFDSAGLTTDAFFRNESFEIIPLM